VFLDAQVMEMINDAGFTGDWYQTKPISDDEYIIVAGNGTLIRWNIQHRTFKKMEELKCRFLSSFAAENDKWFVGTTDGAILTSTDQGMRWLEFATLNGSIHDLQVQGGVGYGISSKNEIFRFDVNTHNLQILTTIDSSSLRCFDVFHNTITVAGLTGLVIQSTDGGQTWDQLQWDTTNRITAICRLNDSTIVFGGSKTRVWSSFDNGRTMAEQSILYEPLQDLTSSVYDKQFAVLSIVQHKNTLIVAGTMYDFSKIYTGSIRNVLYTSSNMGKSWRSLLVPGPADYSNVNFTIANAVIPYRDGRVYLVEPAFDVQGSARISYLDSNSTVHIDTIFLQQHYLMKYPNKLQKNQDKPYHRSYVQYQESLFCIGVMRADPGIYDYNQRLYYLRKSTDNGVTWITAGQLPTTVQAITDMHVADGRIWILDNERRVLVSTDEGLTFSTITDSLPKRMWPMLSDTKGRQLVLYSAQPDTVGPDIHKGSLYDLQSDGSCTRIELPGLTGRFSVGRPLVFKDSLYVVGWELDAEERVSRAILFSNSLPLSHWNTRQIPHRFEKLKSYNSIDLLAATEKILYLRSGQLQLSTFDLTSGVVSEENVWPEVDIDDPFNSIIDIHIFVDIGPGQLFTYNSVLKFRWKGESAWRSIRPCGYVPEPGGVLSIIKIDSVTWFVGYSGALYHLHLDAPATSVSEYPQPESDVRSIVIQRDQPLLLDNATTNAVLYTTTGEVATTIPVGNGVPCEVPVSQFAPGVYYLVEKTPQQHRITKVMVAP